MIQGIRVTLVKSGNCLLDVIPDNPADCAATELIFEEATCGLRVVEEADEEAVEEAVEEVLPNLVAERAGSTSEEKPICPLSPEVPWDKSICGKLTEQILARIRAEEAGL